MKKIMAIAAVSALAGCATHNGAVFQAQVEKMVAPQAGNFPKPETSTNLNLVEIRKNSVYLGNKALTARPDDKLPPIFDDKDGQAIKALVYERQPLNILELAEKITRQFRIPVEISQNVYLASQTLPTEGGAQAGKSSAASSDKKDQVLNFAFVGDKMIQLNDYDSLRSILNRVAARIGISWDYADGRIQFYRFKTKTFDVVLNAGKQTESMKFNSAGTQTTGGAGQQGGSTSQLTLNLERGGDLDPWKDFSAEVSSFRSAGGSVVTNPSAGTVTVTDTPTVLAKVDDFVKGFNRKANREVVLQIDLYSLKKVRANQFALQASGVFTSPNGKIRTFAQSPMSLLTNEVGAITGISLPPKLPIPTTGNPGTAGDAFVNGAGSSLALNGVAQWDDVTRVNGLSLRTRNQVPVSLADSFFQEYPRSISTSQGNSTTEVSIQQGTVTTGYTAFFTPRVMDDNRVLLHFAFDLSDPGKFSSTTVGGTSIQSAQVSRKAPVLDLSIVPGRPVPVLQLTRKNAFNRTNAGFGGSTADGDTDEDLLLVVTATLAS